MGSRVRGLNMEGTEAGTSSAYMVSQEWSQPQEDGGEDEAGELIFNQYGVPGAWCQPGEDGARDKAGGPEGLSSSNMGSQMRGLNLQKTEAGARREGLSSTNMKWVPGAWSQPGQDREAGTRPKSLSSTNMGFQVWSPSQEDWFILKQYGVAGAWRHLDRTEARAGSEGLSPTNTIWGPGCVPARGQSAYPQAIWGYRCVASPGKDRGTGGVGGLISNQYGVPGAFQPEARAHILNQYGGLNLMKTGLSSSNMGSQVPGLNPKRTESGDKAGALILDQYGVPGAWSLQKTEAGTRPENLSSSNMGSQVRGTNLKKTEAATRTECLSSTNMGSRVWSQPQEQGGRDNAEGLILKQYGIAGAWSQPGEDRGGDKAGGLEGLSSSKM